MKPWHYLTEIEQLARSVSVDGNDTVEARIRRLRNYYTTKQMQERRTLRECLDHCRQEAKRKRKNVHAVK